MGAAAAAVLIHERRIVNAFDRAGATSPERARPLSDLAVDPGGLGMRRLHERAVVREASPGMFYLDREVWQAVRRTRRRVALVIMIVLLAAIALGFFSSRPA